MKKNVIDWLKTNESKKTLNGKKNLFDGRVSEVIILSES